MAFLRKGFLKSAHRRNELYCRIDLPLVAIMVFFPLLVIFMTVTPPLHQSHVDRVVACHVHKLPGARREDAIKIYVTRDGSIYFGRVRVQADNLPELVRDAVRHGAEKRIYLEVDARAQYRAVNGLIPQIQMSGIQSVSLLADSPRPTVPPASLPTP